MKKLLFLTIFIFVNSIGVMLCADNATPSQATTWHGVEKCVYPPYMDIPTRFRKVTYYLEGDTIINDTVYQAFWRDNGEYCAGIRQSADGQQVYIRPTEQLMKDWWESGDHMLYNFDVEVGDTVFAYDGSFVGLDDIGLDWSIQYRWIVLDVQTIEGRKHIFVKGGQLRYHQVEWIEGIGTRYILFENDYDGVFYEGHSTYALCAADSEGNILYSFNTDEFGIRNNCPDWEVLAIENPVAGKSSACKFLRDGQLLIEQNGRTYNAQGAEIR